MRDIVQGIGNLVRIIKLAHFLSGLVRQFGCGEFIGNFFSYLRPQRIGIVELNIVSAGVCRREHREHSFTGVKRDAILLRRRKLRRQYQAKKNPNPIIQATPQTSQKE